MDALFADYQYIKFCHLPIFGYSVNYIDKTRIFGRFRAATHVKVC